MERLIPSRMTCLRLKPSARQCFAKPAFGRNAFSPRAAKDQASRIKRPDTPGLRFKPMGPPPRPVGRAWTTAIGGG